ncbi:hypothetical protein MMAG44476_34079 [Mycolicibacterium mageritense DSM 44476 = CIP 104973]|uniref:Uncharacterized protein n=1 Tax=Mycolicibacterium mageritense TaxID=53462 RepID=A0AAI8XNK1_MYCME|nr:hypothetical protein [Mycolicibacterium mageritense]MCC9184451.1 hypothetical protein [Mycolicibacterium mageritense]BBX32313.1 hypothetical protein MMAGJ_15950 [Mycolicibacterium mageritense]BDY29005.1 hypothetical protein hbim_02941 [Mycolicibacterium mageritense]CDO23145.1 hypothetical protein BN978_03625 [Mycolicibacterium mageritense DSM 44476 = CIP 104973]
MAYSITRIIFVISAALALLGGLVFVGCQAIGLAVGAPALVDGPNGIAKTILCIAGSVAAIAAFLLGYLKHEVPVAHEKGVVR